MPRPVYHYNREGALCLEKGITMPSSGIGLERKLMEETFSAWKKKNVNLLRRFLLRMVRNGRLFRKKLQKAWHSLMKELEASRAERKACSVAKRFFLSLPVLSSSVTVAVKLFTFFAAVAAAERGAWGMIGGEVFLVGLGVYLFYRFASKFI